MKLFAKIQFFFIISLVGAVFFSCDPNEDLPPQTILEYLGHQIYRNSTTNEIERLNLQIHFQDGNGNIGIAASEVGAAPFVDLFENNLFVHALDKQDDDTFTQMIINDTISIVYKYCVPYYEEPSVKGTFDINIESDLQFMQMKSRRGIVKFQIYMFDRDLVSSDTIYTPEITIR